ncbi:hypothetical protein [Domibacillus aminovorans]|uniref:DUF3906 domain-containing protein n=1 Tax=Domibacillus aminovorans TaxID=29332 RepID=A0A177L3W2_9BACI|nr:hypothetical protein [Domibacillus aminovorans]OAH60379.1 hypothetical protein AWH49_16765 [Domibacillus aminovorans]
MVYDVEVVQMSKGERIPLFTALIYADSVTECRKAAEKMLEQNYGAPTGAFHVDIEEGMECQM